jgi:hypothetical protein
LREINALEGAAGKLGRTWRTIMPSSPQPEHSASASTPAPKLPDTFRLVRLRLAREHGHPEGDSGHGYDILAPLADDGSIDAHSFRARPSACRVRRFRPGEDDAIGRLVHGPGGAWSIEYDGTAYAKPEAGYHFRDERFRPGEYVSIREDDNRMHTLLVWEVRRP